MRRCSRVLRTQLPRCFLRTANGWILRRWPAKENLGGRRIGCHAVRSAGRPRRKLGRRRQHHPVAGHQPGTGARPFRRWNTRACDQVEARRVYDRWPQVLPGGQAILFTASTSAGTYDGADMDVISLNTGERKTVARGGFSGSYLPTSTKTGHRIYLHQSTLFAVAFDPSRLAATGSPVPILEDVSSNIGGGGDLAFEADRSVSEAFHRPLGDINGGAGAVDLLGGQLRQNGGAASASRPRCLRHTALLARRQTAGVRGGERPERRHMGEGSGSGRYVAAHFPKGPESLARVDFRREEHRVPIHQPGSPRLVLDPVGRIGRGAAPDRRQDSGDSTFLFAGWQASGV